MSHSLKSATALGALVLGLSGPVSAQEVADEMVTSYFNMLRGLGADVAFEGKDTEGSTVTWSGITAGFADSGIAGSMTVPWVKAEERDDGTVRVTIAPKHQVIVDTSGAGGSPLGQIVVDGVFSDYEVIVTPGETSRQFDSTLARYDMTITTAGEVGLNGTATMTGLEADAKLDWGEGGGYSGTSRLEHFVYDYEFADGRSGMSATAELGLIESFFDTNVVTPDDILLLLSGERDFRLGIVGTEQSATSRVTSGPLPIESEVSLASSAMNMAIVDGFLEFDSLYSDLDVAADVSAMGLPPMDAQMAEFELEFAMPLRQSEEALPMDVKFGLTDLSLSESIWALFDPSAQLPRDPASLQLDAGLGMRWLVNLLEIDSPQAPANPVELVDFDLRSLSLEAAGAKLSGQGSAVFDNSGFEPMPVGSVDLDLKGGFGLLDKLIAMGLVQPEQNMMIRAMSGIFAVPGDDGPDHLVSTIEIAADGSVLANGQRIQ